MSNSDPFQRAHAVVLSPLVQASSGAKLPRLLLRFDAAVVKDVVTWLKKHAMMDNANFAKLWKGNRNSLEL